MRSASDRRKNRRVAVDIPVNIFFKDSPKLIAEGKVLDISEGGAFIHCTLPVPIGREVLLEIRFQETKVLEGRVIEGDDLLKKSVPAPGAESSIVRWVRGSSHSGFGIEFVGLHADKKRFLLRLIQYFEALDKPAEVSGKKKA